MERDRHDQKDEGIQKLNTQGQRAGADVTLALRARCARFFAVRLVGTQVDDDRIGIPVDTVMWGASWPGTSNSRLLQTRLSPCGGGRAATTDPRS